MNTYLDVVHFETYVSACATRSGTRVVWEDENAVPRTDGKTMWLPRINSGTAANVLLRLRYFLKHETSHVVHTDFEYWKKAGPQGLLMLVVNCLEDNRIDYVNDAEYPGDRQISGKYMELYVQEVRERLTSKGPLSEQQQLLMPLLAWDEHHREWIPSAVLSAAELEKGLSPESQERFDKLMAGNYGERLRALRTSEKGGTDDLSALADDIMRDIFKQNPENYKKPENTSKEKGKGEGEEESGEASAQSAGDNGENTEAGTGEAAVCDDIITVEELTKAIGDHVIARSGVHYKHEIGRGGYSLPMTSDYVFVKWPVSDDVKSRLVGSRYGAGKYIDYNLINNTLDTQARPLSNKLRLRLQIRSQGRWENGKKRGSLHGGSLHRIITSKGTEQENRVFRKHIVSDTLDTAVSLLVDCSGSMGGRKFNMACASAATLGVALEPLHIHYTMNGFTNTHELQEYPIIFQFKRWSERVVPKDMLDRFNLAAANLANNTDGDAIAWAAHDLMQRQEKRKILIVLSDGSPAGGYERGDITRYTKEVVQKIEDDKHIEIHGIGICDKNVQMYYKNNVTINSPEELPNAILTIIDKAV